MTPLSASCIFQYTVVSRFLDVVFLLNLIGPDAGVHFSQQLLFRQRQSFPFGWLCCPHVSFQQCFCASDTEEHATLARPHHQCNFRPTWHPMNLSVISAQISVKKAQKRVSSQKIFRYTSISVISASIISAPHSNYMPISHNCP